MKKFFCLTIIVMFLLTGCSDNFIKEKEDGVCYSDNFIIVESNSSNTIYVDKNTRVMYWKQNFFADNSCMTVLFNSDGTPMLWEGELE